MANAVIENGGLTAIFISLGDFDNDVKESAAWAAGYIARHNESLALAVINTGCVPLLVLCLQETGLCLKQISASALCDIAKHSTKLAEHIADAGAVAFLASLIDTPDFKLKRQVFYALASIAKHTLELAEAVVEADILVKIISHLGHFDDNVRKAGAVLTREIVKHSQQLSQMFIDTGGLGILIDLVSDNRVKSSTKLPGIMALGYIAGHSAQSSMIIISLEGVNQLSRILTDDNDCYILSIVIWTLGQIGRHSAEHVCAVASGNVFARMLQLYESKKSTDDLKSKIKFTLKNLLDKCENIEILEQFLSIDCPEVLKYTLHQLSKILPQDAKSRRLFVSIGGLKKIQEIQLDTTSNLQQNKLTILSCFPDEVVRYFSPGYQETILDIVDTYQPKLSNFFGDGGEAKSLSLKSNSILSADQHIEIQ